MKLTFKILFFSYFFCFSAFSTEVNKDIDFVNLSVGFQYEHDLPASYNGKQLKFEGTYTRYTKVLYKSKANMLLFKPRRVGIGTLIIKDVRNKILQKINIDVKKVNLHTISKEISDLLVTIDGISIKILNHKVIVDGEVLLPKEMNRINTVVDEYKANAKSMVTLSPQAQNQIARLIEKEIGYLVPPDEVRVKSAYNRFVLEGEVGSEAQKERAFIIANLHTQFDAEGNSTLGRKNIKSVINLITIRKEKKVDQRKKIIQIIIHYVELEKSYNKGFIFQWKPQIKDNTGVQISASGSNGLGIVSAITATISNFFPKLNWATSFNFARVLHNSNLTLQEGVTGVINVQTQIPYTTRQPDGEFGTSSAASGIKTTVTPTIIGPRKDTVNMKVNVEVGSVGGQTDTGPIMNTRVIQTTLHVRAGLSAVLGGLISSALRKDYNRFPGQAVKDVPIINLQSSRGYDTTKTQFVVFITPIIRGSASSGVERIKKKFRLDGY